MNFFFRFLVIVYDSHILDSVFINLLNVFFIMLSRQPRFRFGFVRLANNITAVFIIVDDVACGIIIIITNGLFIYREAAYCEYYARRQ